MRDRLIQAHRALPREFDAGTKVANLHVRTVTLHAHVAHVLGRVIDLAMIAEGIIGDLVTFAHLGGW